MAKEVFKDVNFNLASLQLLTVCEGIVARYQTQGLKLTLRQLYYQLVTTNAIKNEERSYKNLGTLVSNGRLAGRIDWGAIEDRIRVPRLPNEYTGLRDLIDSALYWYRLPRWKDQEYYAELWVEKDALAGVLEPLAREFHVTMMVNRGYSSQSAMYEASRRFGEHDTKQCVLFYLGDHDPSGEDMVRDIRDRLEMFGVTVEVTKLAITFDQVQQYNPPPNPTKLTDSRAAGYIEKFGHECWEVDALPPDVLQGLIRNAFEAIVDVSLMNAIKEQEAKDKYWLRQAVKKRE